MSPGTLSHVAPRGCRLTFLFGTCETHVPFVITVVSSATHKELDAWEFVIVDTVTWHPVRSMVTVVLETC